MTDTALDGADSARPIQAAEQAAGPVPAAGGSDTHLVLAKEMGYGWMVLLLALWTVTCFMGSASIHTTREAFLTTSDGVGIERCYVNDAEADPEDWCEALTGRNIGPLSADEIESTSGGVIFDAETIGRMAGETVIRPDMWLGVGLGAMAIISIWVFARATGTFRAGIAAGVVVVFLGLLLLPSTVTFGVPNDLRSELIWAWGLVIGFYFTTEAVIQGLRIRASGDASVAGDLVAPSAPASEGSS